MENKIDYKRLVRILLIIALATLLIAAFLWYDQRITKNFVMADRAANTLSSSMYFIGYLPWNAEDDSLRAVLKCDTETIFVRNNKTLQTTAIDCGYYLAQGIILEPVANGWSGEGSIRFIKDGINE